MQINCPTHRNSQWEAKLRVINFTLNHSESFGETVKNDSLQLLQNLSNNDKTTHWDFYTEILEHCENEERLMEHLILSDKLTVFTQLLYHEQDVTEN